MNKSKNNILKAAFLSLVAVGVVSMTGCNTVSGAGKDIQSGGHAISRSANNVQSDM